MDEERDDSGMMAFMLILFVFGLIAMFTLGL